MGAGAKVESPLPRPLFFPPVFCVCANFFSQTSFLSRSILCCVSPFFYCPSHYNSPPMKLTLQIFSLSSPSFFLANVLSVSFFIICLSLAPLYLYASLATLFFSLLPPHPISLKLQPPPPLSLSLFIIIISPFHNRIAFYNHIDTCYPFCILVMLGEGEGVVVFSYQLTAIQYSIKSPSNFQF